MSKLEMWAGSECTLNRVGDRYVNQSEKYVGLAEKEPKITFIGRLGTYRYLNMHVIIGESLDLAQTCMKSEATEWPKFSNHPLA